MKGQRLRAANFFVLRAPLLPTKALFATTRPGEDAAIHDVLTAAFARHDVRRAMQLGTENFPRLEKAWRLSAGGPPNAAAVTLLGYLHRMVGRPAPFGLFASVSLGTIGGASSVIEVRGDAESVTHVRPSLRAHFNIAQDALRSLSVIRRLEWEPSPGAFRAGGQIRFLAADGTTGDAHYVALELAPPIQTILNAAAGGAKFEQIVRALAARRRIASAEEFVVQLIGCGLLVPRRGQAPPLNHPRADELRGWLRRTAPRHLKRLDGLRQGISADDGPATDDAAADHHAELHRNATARLSTSVVSAISRTLMRLRELGMTMSVTMQPEREGFVDRFGEKAVPLLEALDPEYGIGGMIAANRSPGELAAPLGPDVTRMLFQKLAAAGRTQHASIDISDGDGRRHCNDGTSLAERLLAVGTLLPAGEDRRLSGAVFQLKGAYGSAGAHLIARHAWRNEVLLEQIRSWLRREPEEPNQAVQADVAHLAPKSALDLASCPALTDHEIVLDDRCARVPPQRRLYLDDLFVAVRGDRFTLYSRTLDREVVPCISSAHDPSIDSSIPYRFLCALQHQGTVAAIEWNWGTLRDAPVLPRVTMEDVIVSPARWLLSPSGFKDGGIAALRRSLRLPRWVTLTDERDSPSRLLDLQQAQSATWLDRSLRLGDCWLTEVLPVPAPTAIEGRDCYLHEVVIPFNSSVVAPSVGKLTVESRSPRFVPGGEWLYLKLYSGRTSLDAVLAWARSALVSRSSVAVKVWYFVRYADPDWHLRLRLRAPPRDMRNKVLPAVYDALSKAVESGLLQRTQLDTYVPEYERYGGARGFELSERLFHCDSAAVATLIRGRQLDEERGLRQMYQAAMGVDQMLIDFGVTDDQWQSLLKSIRKSHADGQRKLMSVLSDPAHKEAGEAARAAFARRSKAWSGPIRQIKEAIEKGTCSIGLLPMAALHIHMHVNRMLSLPSESAERAIFELVQKMRSRHRALATTRL